MSIVGLTIDYGPFGFLDHYDPNHVCNASGNKAMIAYLNSPLKHINFVVEGSYMLVELAACCVGAETVNIMSVTNSKCSIH